jgi:hypothetical protein
VAVREFIDTREREWRAWVVRPEDMHPVTRAETFMTELRDGWLAFETKDGEVRKRLVLYPEDWHALPPEGLERLLQEAEIVPPRGRRAGVPSAGDAGVDAEDEGGAEGRDELRAQIPWVEPATQSAPEGAADVAQPPVPAQESASRAIRSFLYPQGRLWSVYVQRVRVADPAGGPPLSHTVLRFRSGARTLDLARWPADWATLSDAELVEFLWRSHPRDATAENQTPHRRRHGDARA